MFIEILIKMIETGQSYLKQDSKLVLIYAGT